MRLTGKRRCQGASLCVTDGDTERSLDESKATERQPDTALVPKPCSEPLWPLDTRDTDRTLDQNARKTLLRLTLLGVSSIPGLGTEEHRAAG